MAVTIAWQLEGEQQIARRLRMAADGVKDMKAPFKKAAEGLRSTFERDVFATRGGIIDETWRPLSPVTIARKSLRGYANPSQPLVATGTMKRSFYTIVSSDQAVIGNRSDYFKYHQSNRPRKRLPRRVMMKLANRQREEVVKVFQEHIRQQMRKA